MDGIPLADVAELPLHESIKREELNVNEIFQSWLSRLSHCIEQRSFETAIPELFIQDCWWRDIVALSWDIRSKHGHNDIIRYLVASKHTLSSLKTVSSGGLKPVLMVIGPKVWIQAGFSFETPHGKGRGVVRLANAGKTEWKAWTVSTQLEKLKFEEAIEAEQKLHSPHPVLNDINGVNGFNGANGHASLKAEDPQVIIVGAGQSI